MKLTYIAADDLPRARAALAKMGSDLAYAEDETLVQYLIMTGVHALERRAFSIDQSPKHMEHGEA